MKQNNKLRLKSISFSLAFFLTACGGGGSDDEIANTPEVATQSGTPNGTSSGTPTPSGTPNNTTSTPAIPTTSSAQCGFTPTIGNITDIVLATGQSNLIGPDTEVAAEIGAFDKVVKFNPPDEPHPQVFAWTVDPRNGNAGLGWKVANLTQSWHDTNPGSGGLANNNFAFHFAKQVAERSSTCRVVGIIMVGEGGKGISHWDVGMPGWTEVERHVGEALSAAGKTSLNGILWHQGESDWITDGTCFPGDTCVPGMPDFYPQKLYNKIADPNINNPYADTALIDRLRRRSWFGEGKPFIAAETLKAPVNVHLNKLNDDDDFWTATVRGDTASGLGINATDPFQNHYSAEGLRELGERYAIEYIKMQGY